MEKLLLTSPFVNPPRFPGMMKINNQNKPNSKNTTGCRISTETNSIINSSNSKLTPRSLNLNFSNYSTIEDIYKITKSNTFKSDNYLSILHINIRSLYKNFDKLHHLISQFPFDPSCIAITESKINKKTNMNYIQLKNYDFININSLSAAGGVGLYIKKYLNYD